MNEILYFISKRFKNILTSNSVDYKQKVNSFCISIMLYVCIIKCLKHNIVTMYWVPRILPYIIFLPFIEKK